MIIHKEGYKTILYSLAVLITLSIIFYVYFPEWIVFRYLYNFTAFILAIIIISFFRYPNRTVEFDDKKILCPADGTIVVIEETIETEYFKDKRKQVSNFMSPLNVHANWYPISGIIKYVKYHAGNYFVAFHPKSSTENERTTVVVETNDKQEILFRQIAGALARRIVCYSEKEHVVKQGEQFGFIKFGSRIDLYLPLDATIKVQLKQKVRGKKTVIAELK